MSFLVCRANDRLLAKCYYLLLTLSLREVKASLIASALARNNPSQFKTYTFGQVQGMEELTLKVLGLAVRFW